MKWFKLHSEIKDDPKMLELDDHQRWLWICLLAIASESKQKRGVIYDVRARGLAASLRTSEAALIDALQIWGELGMVIFDEKERTIVICHWDERQYENPSDSPEATRERKRKSRQSHDKVTISHELDTDTDTDINTLVATTTDPAAIAVPTALDPLPLTRQFDALVEELKVSNNKPAVLKKVYVLCYGEATAPDFAYLGRVAKQVGGAGRLAELLFKHVSRPPVGDILAYVLKEHKNAEKYQAMNGGNRAPTEIRFAQNGDDIYA